MKNTPFFLSILSLAIASTSAQAELALGVGIAGYLNPQKGLDIREQAFPMISYTGDRLSFQFTTLTYRLASVGDLQINALASVRSQGYDSKNSQYLTGMKDRKDTLDGGLGLDWKGINLSVSHDILSAHKGSEVSLSYNHGFDLGKLQLSIGGGVNWQSKELTNYYYGVNAAEAKTLMVDGKIFNRIAYHVKSDCIPKANIFMHYALTDSWSLISGAEINFLPQNITNSPIVDGNISWGAFAGIARSF
jgi:outer membrane protein